MIKGGKIATSTGIFEADIAVDQGRIVSVTKETHLPRASHKLNVAGLFVLPGLIDAHVHTCDPGFIRETFHSGTQAAAAGGVTTIIDMASSTELRTSTMAMFSKKKEVAEKQAFVDFGLYGGEIADEKDLQEIDGLVNAGVAGFGEIMMCGDTPIKDDHTLFKAFKLIAEAKSIAAVHAEDNEILKQYKKQLMSKGRTDASAFAEARPERAEAEAIHKALKFAERANCRLHICHLTTTEGVNLVRKAKKRGHAVTAEVCPHHLFFTREAYRKLGRYIITTPPLREREDIKALWAALRDGSIDLVVSDHCAFNRAEKDMQRENVWLTPPGIPGLETLALLMLGKGVKEGKITLEKLVMACCENPAKLFKLSTKGFIKKGFDADFTVIDLHHKHKITTEDLKCVADYTPFDGWTVNAKHAFTLVRGEIIAQENEIVGRAGFGNFVKPH